MRRTHRFIRCGLALLLAGCGSKSHWSVDNCSAIPAGAIPPPNGTHVREIQDAETAKARADAFVIYRSEWCQGGHELGPFGKYHIQQIIKRLPCVPYPVVVQPELDDQINEMRRQVIVQDLALAGVPEPDKRVVVCFPDAEGIYGEEAAADYRQMFRQGGGVGGGYGVAGGIGGGITGTITGGFGGGYGVGGGGFGLGGGMISPLGY